MAKNKKQNPLKGIVCGVIAGATASAVMDLYWGIVHFVPGSRPEQKPKGPADQQIKNEPSTQIVADKVSKAATGHEVPKEDKAAAGVAVHYTFGSFWGGVFGALAARQPGWGLLAGIVYGIGIWIFGDEISLRLLNVAPKIQSVPVSQHLEALGAHLVYGSGVGLITRLLLRMF